MTCSQRNVQLSVPLPVGSHRTGRVWATPTVNLYALFQWQQPLYTSCVNRNRAGRAVGAVSVLAQNSAQPRSQRRPVQYLWVSAVPGESGQYLRRSHAQFQRQQPIYTNCVNLTETLHISSILHISGGNCCIKYKFKTYEHMLAA